MSLWDVDAERFLLGAVLTSAQALADAYPVTMPQDFSVPAHAAAFEAAVAVWKRGDKPDPVTVAAGLDAVSVKSLGGAHGLLKLMAECPAPSLSEQYAHRVASVSVLRRLHGVAAEIADLAKASTDAAEAVDAARAMLAELDPPTRCVDDLVDLDSLVDGDDDPFDWVIPDVLEHQDRVILVAPEGYGKSTLYRQVAVMAGQGIHPFRSRPIRPVSTLLVDLENPPRIIRRKCRPIVEQARRQAKGYETRRSWLWHQPGGINLRSRTDRTRLDAVLRAVRPELVCLGPLYKAYRAKSLEKDDLVASEVIEVFDDLRTRHGFALLLEHHAPKKQGGVRELNPFGSSVWMRWPEFGPKLVPVDESGRVMRFGHWRPPRDERDWPKELHRGLEWPWESRFERAWSAS